MTSGFLCTSAGVPSAIFRPKSSTTTLSDTCMTRLMWCSTSRIVRPRWARTRGMVRHRAEIQEVQELLGLGAACRFLARDPAELERVRQKVAGRAAVGADHDVLQDALRGEEGEILERATDAEPRD